MLRVSAALRQSGARGERGGTCAMLRVLSLLSVGVVPPHHHRQPRALSCSQRTARLVANQQPRRSVASVVGSLHGGKYDFGAASADAQQFAAALASSTAASAADADADSDSGRPSWASTWLAEVDRDGVLRFNAQGSSTTVDVTNIYSTWEPYYASVLGDGASAFELGQAEGTLAPRGGANNVCDPSKPYSDRACVVIKCVRIPASAILLIRTEQSQLTFDLCAAENAE